MIIILLFSGKCGLSSISILGNSTEELADHGEYSWNVSQLIITKFINTTRSKIYVLVEFSNHIFINNLKKIDLSKVLLNFTITH